MGKKKRNREYAKSIKQSLPQWVEDGFPARKPVLKLSAMQEVNGTWIAYVTDDEDTHYANPVEAYDARNSNEVSWEFSSLVSRPEWGSHVSGLFFQAEGNQNRLLLAHTSEDGESIVRSDYYYFLKLTKKYRKNPNDWELAYEWLRSHPIFWHLQWNYETKDFGGYWETGEGFTHMWTGLMKGHKRKRRILLEHGPWHEHRAASLDHRLNAWAPNFEKAYIKLAKNVDKYYAEDGTEREAL